MGAITELYCDDCGGGCCADGRVLCGGCLEAHTDKVTEVEGDLEDCRENLDEANSQIQELDNVVEGLRSEVRELQDVNEHLSDKR